MQESHLKSLQEFVIRFNRAFASSTVELAECINEFFAYNCCLEDTEYSIAFDALNSSKFRILVYRRSSGAGVYSITDKVIESLLELDYD